MSKCWDCRKEIEKDVFRCIDCFKKSEIVEQDSKRRRALTEYERKKLGWYRSEKKWIESIQTRRFVTGKDGSKIVVDNRGMMPVPPKLPDKKINIEREKR